jgi:CRP-like cAMP-binding protein
MEVWRDLANAHPRFAEVAMGILGGHLQDAFTRLREVSAADVQQRIARTLLRLVRQSGCRTEQGLQIAFPITRQDIAEMASTTLHTVSRTLRTWEHVGVLTGGRRRIVVLDPRELVRIADGGAARRRAAVSGSSRDH